MQSAPGKKLKQELRSNGLRYVTDAMPGITRRLKRDTFEFVLPDGSALHDEGEIARIRALAIPPAYTDVWICPLANGHLQATGRDMRGRKQYRYHPQWRALRDDNKYEHMLAFGRALPRIRRRVSNDLKKPLLSRENILATVIRLLERTLIRVGNEEYAHTNKSFGLTTLRDRHVEINGDRVLFKFRGKSGQSHKITLTDKTLARVVKRARDLPGQELFQYVDEEGESHAIDSADVNAYLKEISGEDFTAKDFRTWAGTVLAASLLCQQGATREGDIASADGKKVVVETIRQVAAQLGNTPAICRRCYVHPRVIEAFLDRSLASMLTATDGAIELRGLYKEERALLRFLQESPV